MTCGGLYHQRSLQTLYGVSVSESGTVAMLAVFSYPARPAFAGATKMHSYALYYDPIRQSVPQEHALLNQIITRISMSTHTHHTDRFHPTPKKR